MSKATGSAAGGTATRRRAECLLDAIRAATLAELHDRGYADVTFEGVARRAKTSKPVLYRRYRTRAHLVFDAVSSTKLFPDESIDTGSLRGDLLRLLRNVVGRFEALGPKTIRGVLGESDDELMQSMLAYTSEAVSSTIRQFLERARSRGEIGPGPVPDRIILLPMVLVRHEVIYNRPFDPGSIPDMIDTVYLPLLRQTTTETD